MRRNGELEEGKIRKDKFERLLLFASKNNKNTS